MAQRGYLPLPTVGSERNGFASCPKDNNYPKCSNCNRLIYHGDCPLGRLGTSHVDTKVNRYSQLMNGSGSDEDLPQGEVKEWIDGGLIGTIFLPEDSPEPKHKHGTGMTTSESYYKSKRKKTTKV